MFVNGPQFGQIMINLLGGDLLDAPRHPQAVQFAGAERLEDQQVEGALEQVRRSVRHTCRLSIGRIRAFV